MRSSIIKTLAYADIFDFPLSSQEIHQRLIRHPATLKQVVGALKKHHLPHAGQFYYLKDRQKIVSQRQKSVKSTHHKYRLASQISSYISWLPTIQAIYLTGTVAAGNATTKDDIDLMIITRPGTLWQTRLVVNLALDALRLRRRPNQEDINNRACLNLWLDSAHLDMPKTHHSLYTAYEIIQAKPLIDKANIHALFLSQNRWLSQFLPNAIKNFTPQPPPLTRQKWIDRKNLF